MDFGRGDGSTPLKQHDVDETLRKKRKIREPKSCYPCRQRKVRCDLSRPCQTCRDRGHPDLCNYHPPDEPGATNETKSENIFGSIAGAEALKSDNAVILSHEAFDRLWRKLESLENSVSDLRKELRYGRSPAGESAQKDDAIVQAPSSEAKYRVSHADVHGIHTRNDNGEVVHFGGCSVPAMLYALGHGDNESFGTAQLKLQALLGQSVLPLFGLDDESATYPFVDLWGLPHAGIQRAEELAKALPPDSQMLRFMRSYRDIAHVVYPGIANVETFQADLTSFLIDRATLLGSDEGVTDHLVYRKSFPWLAILFAVLASGAQCNESSSRVERELTSQVYLCCSFECLRFSNFLSRPRLESIQALLVIGNVLMNNANANAVWNLQGLTVRLAQSLGLHQSCPPKTLSHISITRSKIWWALVWQDSVLAMMYDRSATLELDAMPLPHVKGNVGAYHAIMFKISKFTSGVLQQRKASIDPADFVTKVEKQYAFIQELLFKADEYLKDVRMCINMRERLEYWCLHFHVSYITSELCRPALTPRFAHHTGMQRYRMMCLEHLSNTLTAFLNINDITFYARQSWACIHRGVSSALLLAMLGEHRRDDHVQKLINQFIALIGGQTASADLQELSMPARRGLVALTRLNNNEAPTSAWMERVVVGAADGDVLRQSEYTPATDSDVGLTVSTKLTPDTTHSPYSLLNNILYGPDNPDQPLKPNQ